VRKLGDQRGVADQIQAAALAGQRKYEDAAGVLQNAVAANPGAIQPMVALVRTYAMAGQNDKAEAFLQSVLKASPTNAQARVLLGLVQLSANDAVKAEASFKTALGDNPKDASAYRALSDLYLRQRKNDEAARIIQAGLRELPGNASLRLSFAGIMELKGDYEGAISAYQDMLKDDPGSLVVANNLASLLTDHRTDKASLDQAYAIAQGLAKSQVPQFKDTLGWITYLRGDHRGATALLEEAVAALPNTPVIRYHLGMSYIAIGEKDKAIEQLKKAAELIPDKSSDLAIKVQAALRGQG
jgi:cellulose synthase operon protein C